MYVPQTTEAVKSGSRPFAIYTSASKDFQTKAKILIGIYQILTKIDVSCAPFERGILAYGPSMT